ncbi:hypothetical protein AB0M54_37890 [Actinoplanes sp. NPDC051470]|uniref:hypothetical protein n=1 Tax=Actinoplanes sp. NPDC051470 TaxID=3157224 RepID=UPI0034179A57
MTSWFTAADCRLEDFRAIVEQPTQRSDFPDAIDVAQNVLIYPGDLPDTTEVRAELARALMDGPASWCSGARSRPTWSTAPPRSSPA